MRTMPKLFVCLVLSGFLIAMSLYSFAQEKLPSSSSETIATSVSDEKATGEMVTLKPNRVQVLIASLTVFSLAVIVGFEIIAKVPPTLHTPLMSGSNAISGITVVGALIAAGNFQGGYASFLGLLAVILANINVVGGFCVTHRMLLMFKKK